MKMFGFFEELQKLVFRNNTRTVTVQPASQTTGNSTINIPDMAGTTQSAVLTAQAQTLTNKSIDADTNTITNIDNADIKAAAAIDASKIADGSVDNTEFQRLGTAGTAGAGNLVTTDGSQTLTNKTLTSPIITSPTLTVSDSGFTIQDNGDATKQAKFEASGITTGTTRTFTFPDANTTLVGTDATQTLTNKTYRPLDTQFSLRDNSDSTKEVDFELSGLTTGNTRTLTVPDASGTLTLTGAVQTLTNKSLTTPALTAPTVATSETYLNEAYIALREATGNGTEEVRIKAPAAIGTTYTLAMPTSQGSSGQVLSTDGNNPAQLSWASAVTNPMDSAGDLIVGGASGTPTKLDHPGAAGYVLATTGTSTTAWSNSPLALDASNTRIGVGITSPQSIIHADTTVSAPVALGNEPTVTISTRANGAGIQGYLGGVWFGGSDLGSDPHYRAAGMVGYSASDYDATSGEGSLEFYSTPSGTTTPVKRLTIESAGDLVAANGIRFAALTSQLNWYQEGTFTPTISASGTAFGSVTYGTQVGTYTRIGNIVMFQAYVLWNSTTGSPTGGININGLPFAAKNVANATSPLSVIHSSIVLGAGTIQLMATTNQNSTVLSLIETKDNAGTALLSAASNTGGPRLLIVSGSYLV